MHILTITFCKIAFRVGKLIEKWTNGKLQNCKHLKTYLKVSGVAVEYFSTIGTEDTRNLWKIMEKKMVNYINN